MTVFSFAFSCLFCRYTAFQVQVTNTENTSMLANLGYIDQRRHPYYVLGIFGYRNAIGIDKSVVKIQRQLKYYYDIRLAREIEDMERATDMPLSRDTDAFAALDCHRVMFPIPQLVFAIPQQEFNCSNLYQFIFPFLPNPVSRSDHVFLYNCRHEMKRSLAAQVRAVADAECRMQQDKHYKELEELSNTLISKRIVKSINDEDTQLMYEQLEAAADNRDHAEDKDDQHKFGPRCEWSSYEAGCVNDGERYVFDSLRLNDCVA